MRVGVSVRVGVGEAEAEAEAGGGGEPREDGGRERLPALAAPTT